jgi:hypothetical protein
MAPRYWDLNDGQRQERLGLWRKAAVFRVLELVPTQIRSYRD